MGGAGAVSYLVLALELVNEVVDESVIEILTTQVGVTSSGLDLEDTLLDGKERDIESSTTEIKDENVALTLNLLVQTVGNGSSSWLVDDTENVQASNETGILGSLTLGVVEVSWDGDNGVVDGSSKVGLSGLTHLDEDHGGDLLWGELLDLSLELDLDDWLSGLVNDLEWEVLHIGLDLCVGELATDETLGIEDSVDWVHGDLVFGGITDETLGVGESDERWGSAVTLVVGDNLNAIISVDTHTGVGGTQINTNAIERQLHVRGEFVVMSCSNGSLIVGRYGGVNLRRHCVLLCDAKAGKRV